MKKLYLLITLKFSISIAAAQPLVPLKLQVKDVKFVKLSNVEKFSFYEDEKLNKTCGYYSVHDSCFYSCNGFLITKVKPESVRDGNGCCQHRDDLFVDFSRLHDKSKWVFSDLRYEDMEDGYYVFKNSDSVKVFIMPTYYIAGKQGPKNALEKVTTDIQYKISITGIYFNNSNTMPVHIEMRDK